MSARSKIVKGFNGKKGSKKPVIKAKNPIIAKKSKAIKVKSIKGKLKKTVKRNMSVDVKTHRQLRLVKGLINNLM